MCEFNYNVLLDEEEKTLTNASKNLEQAECIQTLQKYGGKNVDNFFWKITFWLQLHFNTLGMLFSGSFLSI